MLRFQIAFFEDALNAQQPPSPELTRSHVQGQVWRRHNGRRWIYKHFIGYERDE